MLCSVDVNLMTFKPALFYIHVCLSILAYLESVLKSNRYGLIDLK